MVASNLVKLDVLLGGDTVDALSMIVHRDKAYELGADADRAAAHQDSPPAVRRCDPGGGRLARDRARDGQGVPQGRHRKCYGGDITRQAQAAREAEGGQEADEAVGRIEVPQEAFSRCWSWASRRADAPRGCRWPRSELAVPPRLCTGRSESRYLRALSAGGRLSEDVAGPPVVGRRRGSRRGGRDSRSQGRVWCSPLGGALDVAVAHAGTYEVAICHDPAGGWTAPTTGSPTRAPARTSTRASMTAADHGIRLRECRRDRRARAGRHRCVAVHRAPGDDESRTR